MIMTLDGSDGISLEVILTIAVRLLLRSKVWFNAGSVFQQQMLNPLNLDTLETSYTTLQSNNRRTESGAEIFGCCVHFMHS